MDFQLLMFVRSSTCKTALAHSHFDRLINDFYQRDVKLEMHLAFDVIAECGVLPSKALDIVYSQLFCPDDDNKDYKLEDEVAGLATCVLAGVFRSRPVECQHMNWKHHVKMLQREGEFHNMYQMSYSSFKELRQIFHQHLSVDDKQSRRRTGGQDPVIPELTLHCFLRYIAGGSFHDIRTSAGLARTAF